MAIQTEVWIPAIEDNLYKGFEVMRAVASDDSSYAQNTTVHVPNAGASPIVTRGNSTYPVTIAERTDADVSYDLTNFEIGPVRLGWADGLQLIYDKVASVTNDFMGNMLEHMQKYICSQWWTYDSDLIVSTSHASLTATNWLGGTASGSLKLLTGDNVRQAAEILDREKFPSGDRYLLLDYKMYWQLLKDVSYNDTRIEVLGGFQSTIDNIYGFKVIQLPFVAAVSANTGSVTMIEPSATDGSFTFTTNHRPIGLAFHKSAVSFAWTAPKPFSQDNDPTMFGDILSASVYGGGKYRRTSANGVVAIRATA
jgi:hypothetical protein